MKTKIYYIAKDKTEHGSEAEAIAHEKFIDEIAAAIKPLGKRYDNGHCDYANGDGYVQHHVADVLKAKIALIEITKRVVPHKIWEYPAAEIHPQSFAGRLLCGCNKYLYKAWFRFMCIDEKGREWGQPYYSLHPERATHKEL